jgi:CheY-like chemotaxis protein
LVDDDNEASIYINQRILKKLEIKADIRIAKHGQEALDIMKEDCLYNSSFRMDWLTIISK